MSEMHGTSEGPGAHQQRLVKTDPDEIDPHTRAALGDFCAYAAEVELLEPYDS